MVIKMKHGTRNDKGTTTIGWGKCVFGNGIWEVCFLQPRRLRKFGTIGHFSDNPTTLPLLINSLSLSVLLDPWPVRWNKYPANFSTYAHNHDMRRTTRNGSPLKSLPLRWTSPLNNFEGLWQELEAFEITGEWAAAEHAKYEFGFFFC